MVGGKPGDRSEECAAIRERRQRGQLVGYDLPFLRVKREALRLSKKAVSNPSWGLSQSCTGLLDLVQWDGKVRAVGSLNLGGTVSLRQNSYRRALSHDSFPVGHCD